MRIWKRLLGTALCLCTAVCLMSVSASAAEHSHPICGKTHTDIGDHTGPCSAVEWIEVTQAGVTDNNGLTLETGKSYYLGEDISVEWGITITGTVNLCLNGHSITKTSESTDFMGVITVEAGSSFTLCDCNGSGASNGKITHADNVTGRGVLVGSSEPKQASFIMYGGTISGNRTNSQDGAGVRVHNASFRMYGGTITDNHVEMSSYAGGGGVAAHTSGKFIMYGGEISRNTSNGDGGGVGLVAASFQMYGGSIINNNATYGGGVSLWNDSFTLSGGSISGNNATDSGGGVYFSGYTFNVSGDVNITGNVVGSRPNNIYLPTGKTITVAGELTGSNKIGVTTEKTPNDSEYVQIASGNASDAAPEKFRYENDDAIAVSAVVIGSTTKLVACQHNWSGAWETDTHQHWHVCSICKGKNDPVAHTYDTGIIKTQPTCTTAGEKTYTCADCGRTKTETLAALGHSYGKPTYVWNGTNCTAERKCSNDNSHKETETVTAAVETTRAATCALEELSTYTAAFTNTAFNKQKKENVVTAGKLEHDYAEEFTVDKPATCIEEGSKSRHCSRCDAKTDVTVISAAGHRAGAAVKEKEVPATCTTDGSYDEVVYCVVCNAEVSHEAKTVAALGHDYTVQQHDETQHWKKCSRCDATDTKAHHSGGTATCVAKAECTTCGVEYGAFAGHIWGTWTSNGDGTHTRKCETAGCAQTESENCSGGAATCQAKAVCLTCGQAYGELDGHSYTAEIKSDDTRKTAGTCTSEAVYYYSCSVCWTVERNDNNTFTGEKNPANHTGALGDWQSDENNHWKEYICCNVHADDGSHHWDEGKETKSPTCTASGEKAYTCADCGRRKTEQIDALGHDWQAAACETPETCMRCHVTQGKALGHDWGRYTVTTPATETSEGVETRTCQRDSAHTQTRPIPKLPASTYGVSGEVHKSDGSPAEDVKVTLVLGDRQIASTTTVEDGSYRFGNVAPGVYNLVIEKDDVTVTVKVEVVSANIEVGTITMPQGKTSSVVEVKSDDSAETVEAVVGNLEKVFETTGDGKPFTDEDKTKVEQGGSVEIKLTVTKTDEDETSAAIRQELPADTKVGVRLELDVSKTVTETNGSSETTPVTDTDVLLETIIQLPAALQGKDSYTVYRLHGADVHMLTAQKSENGEYIEVSSDRTAITIHAKLYSEYVIAYQECGETGGGGGNDNGSGHDDNDDDYTPPSVPAQPETNIGYRACRRDDACPIRPFADTASTAWYHDGVHYCVEKGLMHGISADKFLPNGSTTRAQLVTILWRLEGSPTPASVAGFSDVADGAWYAGAVRWAADSGVVKGYDNGNFGPDDAVTREQMVTILYRFAQHKGYDVSAGEDTNILSFNDALTVSEYAIPAMQWACGSGMVNGIAQEGEMFLAPKDTTTRAQIATLMMRFQGIFTTAV